MAHRGIAFAVGLIVATLTVWAQPQHPAFPPPDAQPEIIPDTEHFPYLPPLPGARLIQTKTIDGPVELKPATAEDEAVLAGRSYVEKTYHRPNALTPTVFLNAYRDALFASGWKLVDVTKLEAIPVQRETVNVAAHYRENGRNLYARVSQEPGGAYQISVADVGAEDWKAALARDCLVRVHSIHFDLDRPAIRLFESEPTLQKLADLLRSRSTPALEIQGHVDSIGEAESAARQALSEGRAKAVAAWLTSHGVPARKVTSRGYGKTRPIAENDSDLGRALNRRIEVACLRD
jgi:outer membrane protein OmpA-like peptidoglycan-associated protein